MRALLQRVSRASVSIGAEVIGRIGPGLVVLLGVSREDTEQEVRYVVDKSVNLRIFSDDEGKSNRSALDIGAELLIVSQFTLYGDTRKGRRPSFVEAADPGQAKELFARAVTLFKETGLPVEKGRFREHMLVSIDNDGPVTIMLDSADQERPRRR